MKPDLTFLSSKAQQASLLIALLQWCCINSLEFIYISVPDCIFSCSFPTLKKRILNSSEYFLARLSWLTVLSKLASFKAKDDFKWKVVIKNLEQEAEALWEDRKNPWLEPEHFSLGFLLSAHSWRSAEQPREPHPHQGHTSKGGWHMRWAFPSSSLGKPLMDKWGGGFCRKFCLGRVQVNLGTRANCREWGGWYIGLGLGRGWLAFSG